jgi:hypothetical protein
MRTATPTVERSRVPGAVFGIGAPLVGLLIGTPAVALVLVLMAGNLGYFDPTPVPDAAARVDTIHLPAPKKASPRDLNQSTDASSQTERARIIDAISQVAPELRSCGLTGRIDLDVRVSLRGQIQEIRSAQLSATTQPCAERALRHARIHRTSPDDVRIRLNLSL